MFATICDGGQLGSDEPKIIIFIETDAKPAQLSTESNPAITAGRRDYYWRAGMPPDRLIACQQGRNSSYNCGDARPFCDHRKTRGVQLRLHLHRSSSSVASVAVRPSSCAKYDDEFRRKRVRSMQNDTAFWPRAFSLRCKTHEIALFADDTARPQKPKPVAIFYGLFSRSRCAPRGF